MDSITSKVSILLWLLLVILLGLTACNAQPPVIPNPTNPAVPTEGISTPTPTATPEPPRFLSICLGQEPQSLFLYADQSLAARNVRAAIYDGPFDMLQFETQPVILEKTPRLADGDVRLETIEVRAGDWIVDKDGKLTALSEGVVYFPSGCAETACAKVYSGSEPAVMDHLVVRFRLKPGLLWSDGSPLTAADSQYSYRLASALYPRYRPDLINHTLSYQSLDDANVEWRGVPGYRDPQYATNFFTPLPEHAWGIYPPDQLLTEDASNRKPIGWGAYIIEEWTPGDHITLGKNPNYFRSAEGLPAFDRLTFRFVSGDEALAALQAGECDLVDKSALSEAQAPALAAMNVKVAYENAAAWEHLDFNLSPLIQTIPAGAAISSSKELRQAMAACIDRPAIAEALFPGQSQAPDSYVPPNHPLHNPDVRQYRYDPQAASAALTALGWLDSDNNPQTPRLAQGVTTVPDGTPLQLPYLTITGPTRQQAAEMLKTSLAGCGVQVDIQYMEADQLFNPGPDGPVFGRQFTLAQFGWESSAEPACFLYTSEEIPGPYPQYLKGWGGANASGYSNLQFDLACRQALNSLPDQPEHSQAHQQAQALYAEDLPSLPLYLIPNRLAMRPDMCGVAPDASAGTALWNLEKFDYGEGCSE
jgi:peptide/nickel transport system substrate-binding protein